MDDAQDVGQIHTLRVRHARAVSVRNERVHGEDRIRAAQDIGAAGITEADAAFVVRGIGRQLDEFVAQDVVALSQHSVRKTA